jgi:hypothetical protein
MRSVRTRTEKRGVRALKKTSVNVDEQLWRRFRAQCVLDGREVGATLAELVGAWLVKREKPKGGVR